MEVAVNPAISSAVDSQFEPAVSADLRTAMLQRIEELTTPAPASKWRDILGTSTSVRQLSGDPAALVATLQVEFSSAQLLAARVLTEGPEKALRLSPIFGDPSSSFVILRDANRSPTGVMSARGWLSGEEPDWLRLAAECASGQVRGPIAVLAAFTDDDILLLHRLRFEFTSAAGLEKINGRRVRALFSQRAKFREHRKFTITLPGWQICNCVNEPTPTVLRAIAHISRIQKHFGCDPAAAFDVWLPSADEFHDIRSAWNFADRILIAKTLSASLNHSRYSPADALRLVGDRRETSYGVARRHLQRAIETSKFVPQVGEVNVALTKFRQAFQKSVVSKFLALADGNGWEEWRSMMAAELAETWFDKLEIVAAGRRVLAGEYPAYRETFDTDLFDLQLRMSSAFAKLYRLKPPG